MLSGFGPFATVARWGRLALLRACRRVRQPARHQQMLAAASGAGARQHEKLIRPAPALSACLTGAPSLAAASSTSSSSSPSSSSCELCAASNIKHRLPLVSDAGSCFGVTENNRRTYDKKKSYQCLLHFILLQVAPVDLSFLVEFVHCSTDDMWRARAVGAVGTIGSVTNNTKLQERGQRWPIAVSDSPSFDVAPVKPSAS